MPTGSRSSFLLSRRQLLAGAAASSMAFPQTSSGELNIYFGDLHNHGNVGYAQGSLRRSFEIARNHLDFFAFTPHAHWHDIRHFDGSIEDKWINGFAVTRERWPEVLKMAREFDAPGKFAAMVGYEWHSTSLGDYHLIFPGHDAELYTPDDLKELQRFAKKAGCIMIPHHPSPLQGHRGANFSHRDPAVSPLLEIYSEWGNSESDRGPFPFIRHTEPGRWTKNTLQYVLAHNYRFGVIASTDDHLGYPGGWGEGLAAVLAPDLSRKSIMEALWDRRTYAVTGDRIALRFTVNGKMMGRELPYTRERKIHVSVSGWDPVDRIEVLKNNRVIHRVFPVDTEPSAASWSKPVLARFEYGWGPWPALGITRVCDWDFRIRVEGGSLDAVQTCFLPGPLEEERRDKVLERTGHGAHVRSFTALRQQIDDRSQKAVVLKMRGNAATKLTIALEAPAKMSLTKTFAELAESSDMLYTGDFPRESAMINRIVFNEHYESSFDLQDTGARGSSADWYYVRVTQTNGQMAWSSPVWVG
ncbi:MAG TPA: DUF3604 domain-containing protein [Bryobacteraceae bacterium]|nr:DUF3604 domain-containing protein [Bryobacteraceae bacterium]